MITNAQPWDNLKFDEGGVVEAQRKFFGTLYNAYAFFALYANIDRFSYGGKIIETKNRTRLDRWILSELHSLIKSVDNNYAAYEPTTAARLIQNFVIDKLSNWYIRLSRRRFWKDNFGSEKNAAYQTLYECLETISIIAAPIAPFFMDRLFKDLKCADLESSVHLAKFPAHNDSIIDSNLEKTMALAQNITSLGLSLRKKECLRVRQPLKKIMIPVLNNNLDVESVSEII